MKRIKLTDVFRSFAAKRLTAHQVNPKVSNGHEMQGSSVLLEMFGPEDRIGMSCIYYWLPSYGDEEILKIESIISWYDARRGNPHRRPEYRLYYPKEAETIIQECALPGDLAIVALDGEDRVHVMIAASESSWEQKLTILFGLPEGRGTKFEIVEVDKTAEVGLAEDMLLEALGFQIPENKDEEAESLITKLYETTNGKFPKTKEFSDFARKQFRGPCSLDDPDAAIVALMEWETILFRLFEAKLVDERLRQGFSLSDGSQDVESFIDFARSVGNTRFSRAGWAFEHHVGAILDEFGIMYSARCVTEQKKRPDLLFPGIEFYHNADFPSEYLRMLGLKTSLKDRWRQVASEADRIREKHLLTLEAPISPAQMDEMKASDVYLVIPKCHHRLFCAARQSELLTFRQYIDMVTELQKAAADKNHLRL